MIELIGYIAAVLTTASFLPQAIKTLKTRDTQSLSLSMYSIFCTGVLLWLLYGLAIQNWPIVAANAVTLMLAGMILGIKLQAVLRERN
ncbi:SemiSWEET transporter [Planctobacterium marinum]|uniref:Sugar transporter SemiSWEET n=1 Tax=Planctobacterium marinum TaxID=1631968 RepID=A0AA48HT98_9ALTE|nr:sugar transporter SemiSWEET [Planctobacterium marinum]